MFKFTDDDEVLLRCLNAYLDCPGCKGQLVITHIEFSNTFLRFVPVKSCLSCKSDYFITESD
jgi:hypothetical protein